MKTTAFIVAALVGLVMVTPATAQSRDIDLKAADGVTLRATYSSPGRSGPGMLLIHQCNMDRTSWSGVSAALVEAGVHVLTMDLRGFGDSGGEGMSAGFPQLMQKSPADVDMALAYLVAQSGVDGSRVGVGGASCGAMLTADLATRNNAVKTLMLLSGPPSAAAIKHIADTPELAFFGAAAEDDRVIAGVAGVIKGAADGSKHPRSMTKVFGGTEHGLPMFEANPGFEPELLDWLTTQLTSN